MRIVEVDEPGFGRDRDYPMPKDVVAYIYKFLEMDCKYVRIDFDYSEYVSGASCMASFRNALKRYDMRHLPVRAMTKDGYPYLMRTDMPE